MPQLYSRLKNLLVLFILITTSNSNAQKVRPFVGAGAFLHLYSFEKDLQSSPAISFSTGSEYRATSFLSPEIEVNYMFGKFKDRTDANKTVNTINATNRSFSTVNFSFTPKILLGNECEESSSCAYLQILPKYMVSLIDVSETKGNNTIGSPQKEKTSSVWKQNFGLGVGIVINFDTWYSNSLAINLSYNTMRLAEAFDQLNQSKQKTDNVGVYGIEFKYYFGVKRLK